MSVYNVTGTPPLGHGVQAMVVLPQVVTSSCFSVGASSNTLQSYITHNPPVKQFLSDFPHRHPRPCCQSLCLADDCRQHGVNPHLETPPYSYGVQLPMLFESAVEPFDGDSAIVDHLPLWCFDRSLQRLSMRWVGVNDWLSQVLALNQPSQRVAGVPLVTDHVSRMELAGGEPSLLEQRSSLFHVVDVSSADVYHHREFVSSVCQDMDFVAKDVLPSPLSVGFDYPTSIRVGDFSVLAPFTAIGPSLDVGAVDSDRLPKVGQGLIKLPSQAPQDVLDQEDETRLSQLGAEAGERGLTGDVVRRVESASLGYERVVVEKPNQRRDAIQTQVVITDVSPPERDWFIPWPAKTPLAFEPGKENFIGEFLEDGLKLGNDRRNLILRREYSSISGGHLEAIPSFG